MMKCRRHSDARGRKNPLSVSLDKENSLLSGITLTHPQLHIRSAGRSPPFIHEQQLHCSFKALWERKTSRLSVNQTHPDMLGMPQKDVSSHWGRRHETSVSIKSLRVLKSSRITHLRRDAKVGRNHHLCLSFLHYSSLLVLAESG